MARASASLDQTQRMPRLKARSSSSPRSWSIVRRGRTTASRPCSFSVTTATCRTSRGPSVGATRRGQGSLAARADSDAGCAARSATLWRDSSTLRARGTAACVLGLLGPQAPAERRRLRRRRPARTSCGTSRPSVLSSVEASISSPCLTMALPSAAASSRPVGKRSSRAADRARSDQRLELRRDVFRVRRRRLDDARSHDVEQRLAPEAAVQRPTREDLPEHHAERVEIAAPVDALAAGLLGRHVAEFALEDPCSSANRRALAMPKSAIFTAPSNDSRMFCGLTSRWTMSSGCPASSFFSCA